MLTQEWTETVTNPGEEPDWIWHGLVARRQITLLTGLWKAGKTTLLSHLLHHRDLKSELLGRAAHTGVTAVVTGEARPHWRARNALLPPGPNVCYFFRPFEGPADARPVRHHAGAILAASARSLSRPGGARSARVFPAAPH
jgi:AAA domain